MRFNNLNRYSKSLSGLPGVEMFLDIKDAQEK